jgi:2-polyprenyl-3-methyl-5-hydroxy-6-metoxy-1,4-benzoquinol methylase
VELPIPTYYGDEICRVDGVRSAGQVTRASVTALVHPFGLLHRRDLSPVDAGSFERYDVKLDERSSHTEVLARVAPGTRVIDLGAGPGAFASALADKGAVVTTADLHRSTVVDPRVATHVVDLNQPLALPMGDYDQVLLLDVIEHLADPETFLEDLRFSLGSQPRELVLTTPNIAFAVSRLMLAMGQFNYGQTGILDRTHTRLFTFRTIRTALQNAGWDVQEVVGIPAPYAKAIGHGRLATLLTRVNSALIRVAPRMFAYQILVTARSRPHAQHRLATTTALSAQLSA